MKALFLTHEGFGDSIFQSQVIEHCESLSALGYDFDVLTYETFQKSWSASSHNLRCYVETGKLRLWLKRAFNIYFPFSTIGNILILARDLVKLCKLHKYKFIHARADYTAFLCVLLKPIHRLPVVWDCRGDSVDELKFSIERFNFFFRLLLWLLFIPRQKIIRYIAAKLSNRSICVSEPLRDLIISICPKIHISVIPCPVPVEKFYFSLSQRLEFRHRMAIFENDLLFIYSGSMTGYQSINNFIHFYEKILSLDSAYLLIATVDIKKAKDILRGMVSDRLLFINAPYKDMNGLYNASDFALMMRTSRSLNYVASPTKYGEYCLSGLKVIHNDAIGQVSRVSNELGNGVPIDELPTQVPDLESRINIAKSARGIFGRDSLNLIYLECYSSLFHYHSSR
jgi:hypothetical protein